jgi:hypothetical protein
MCDILCQKELMLWGESGRYLGALEREKQLLFFLLAYVAADKVARLPALKSLLQTLRLALLGKKQLSIYSFKKFRFGTPPSPPWGEVR